MYSYIHTLLQLPPLPPSIYNRISTRQYKYETPQSHSSNSKLEAFEALQNTETNRENVTNGGLPVRGCKGAAAFISHNTLQAQVVSKGGSPFTRNLGFIERTGYGEFLLSLKSCVCVILS